MQVALHVVACLFTLMVSLCTLCFFMWQRWNNRCGVEVLWVTSVQVATYMFWLVVSAQGIDVYTGLSNGGQIPLVRYASWAITCPVTLVHLSNLDKRDLTNMDVLKTLQFLICDQLMLFSGMLAKASVGPLKWCCFGVGCLFGSRIFYLVFRSTTFTTYTPAQQRGLLITLVAFYLGWALFPLWFVLEETRVLTSSMSLTLHAVGDLVSKNTYNLLGWYFRWSLLATGPRAVEMPPRRPDHVVYVGSHMDFLAFLKHRHARKQFVSWNTLLSSPDDVMDQSLATCTHVLLDCKDWTQPHHMKHDVACFPSDVPTYVFSLGTPMPDWIRRVAASYPHLRIVDAPWKDFLSMDRFRAAVARVRPTMQGGISPSSVMSRSVSLDMTE